MKNVIICPICSNSLKCYENRLECKNKHTFDISKEGYVNLLNIKDKKSLNPGDNSLMINARQDFLSKQYYKPLKDYLIEKCKQLNNNTILECGAGEGYYISEIANQIQTSHCYAIDISKVAAKKCAKRNKNVKTFVASSYSLPFKDKSFDILIVCFAPFCEDEFARVLKDDGTLIAIKPNKDHLQELKYVLFKDEERIKNNYIYKKFSLYDIDKVSYGFCVDNNEDIQNLFTMTPYFYKCSNSAKERLKKLKQLQITADFEISELKKR